MCWTLVQLGDEKHLLPLTYPGCQLVNSLWPPCPVLVVPAMNSLDRDEEDCLKHILFFLLLDLIFHQHLFRLWSNQGLLGSTNLTLHLSSGWIKSCLPSLLIFIWRGQALCSRRPSFSLICTGFAEIYTFQYSTKGYLHFTNDSWWNKWMYKIYCKLWWGTNWPKYW